MDILSKLDEIRKTHNIKISEGEDFKQAVYNDRMLDTAESVSEKIKTIMNRHPSSKYLSLSTDNPSGETHCHAIVKPH
tara:strand:- start:542 stop:775 length:234 start_codon:yes stop_codon:yes gene_type:complete